MESMGVVIIRSGACTISSLYESLIKMGCYNESSNPKVLKMLQEAMIEILWPCTALSEIEQIYI